MVNYREKSKNHWQEFNQEPNLEIKNFKPIRDNLSLTGALGER
jgi:hypothetical protein